MQAIQSINVDSLLDTLLSLSVAFVLGTLIGMERQYRQRTAGLRTNVLVAVGAAVFVDLANHLNGHEGAVHVMAYVVSGIGFLGAGVIMREEGNVRGLNTAATLWGSAAVGAAAGADLVVEAALATTFVLAANTLLRPLVHAIDRKPMDVAGVEVTRTICLIVERAGQSDALARLADEAARIRLPLRDLDIRPFGDDDVQIEATLVASSIDGDVLDALAARLATVPAVRQAFWSASTTD